MLKKILIALSLLAAVAFSAEIRVGSFTKSSFSSNDARIDKAIKLVNNYILSKIRGSTSIAVIPIAVYTQIVNGFNYKIIAAIKDSNNKTVELIHSIVYSGPFASDFSSQEPTISFYEKLPNNLVAIEEIKQSAMSAALTKSLTSANSELVKINSIIAHPHLVYDEGYYIVSAETSFGNIQLTQYFIIAENSDKTFTVEKTLQFN